MAKLLIINADDFGYCPRRNQGIVECFKKGGITSASLMVTGSAAEDAARQSRSLKLPIGLHLNLTEGCPASLKSLQSSLTDNDGCFLDKYKFRAMIVSGLCEPAIIRSEIEAQIELFCKIYGALPHHVDGHQHVHIAPAVCEIFGSVLNERGILWTRLPHDSSVENCDWMPDERTRFLKQVTEDALRASEVFKNHGIRFPKNFVGATTMGEAMTRDRLQNQLSSIFSQTDCGDRSKTGAESASSSVECTCRNNMPENRTCELMVHPGFMNVDADGGCGIGPDAFSKAPDREHEMNVLTSDAMLKFYKSEGYTLCSYKDL